MTELGARAGACFIVLFLLASTVLAKGAGTKVGDVPAVVPPAAPTAIQSAVICLCTILDELEADSEKAKKAKPTEAQKKESVYLSTYAEYKAAIKGAKDAAAHCDPNTGCISIPLTHPKLSVWEVTHMKKKLIVAEEFFHSAHHSANASGTKPKAPQVIDGNVILGEKLLIKKLILGMVDAIVAETDPTKKAALEVQLKKLENRLLLWCHLLKWVTSMVEIEAKDGAYRMTTEDFVWSTDTATAKKEIADLQEWARRVADYVKALINTLSGRSGDDLCDNASTSTFLKAYKARLIKSVNLGLCALAKANAKLAACNGAAVDVPTLSEALKLKHPGLDDSWDS